MIHRDDEQNPKRNAAPKPYVQPEGDDRTVITPANADVTAFVDNVKRVAKYFSNDEIPRPKETRKTRPNIGFSHYEKAKEQRALPKLPIARELPGSKTKIVTVPPGAKGAATKLGGQKAPAPNHGPHPLGRQSGGPSGGQPAVRQPAAAPAPELRQSLKFNVAALTESVEAEERKAIKSKKMCREEILNVLTNSGSLPAAAQESAEPEKPAESKPPTSLRRLLGADKAQKPAEDYRAVISPSGSYLSMKVESGLFTSSSFEKCQQRLSDIEKGAPMRSRYRRTYSGNQIDTAGMEAAPDTSDEEEQK